MKSIIGMCIANIMRHGYTPDSSLGGTKVEKISTGVLDSFWKQKAADSLEERTRMDGGDEAICELSGFDTLQTETMAGMFFGCSFF